MWRQKILELAFSAVQKCSATFRFLKIQVWSEKKENSSWHSGRSADTLGWDLERVFLKKKKTKEREKEIKYMERLKATENLNAAQWKSTPTSVSCHNEIDDCMLNNWHFIHNASERIVFNWSNEYVIEKNADSKISMLNLKKKNSKGKPHSSVCLKCYAAGSSVQPH